MHHFFVNPDQIHDQKIELLGSNVNHIKNVLRMKVDEELLISDGIDKDYTCKIEAMESDKIVAKIIEKHFAGTELESKFYLFQGMPKSDKMELIIQKAVELGVYEIIPVFTKRCVIKIDEKKRKAKLDRFNAISESAAKQSRRAMIPRVNQFMSLKEALEYAKDFSINIIPYENFKDMEVTREILNKVDKDMKIGIFIGPEGGFEETEIEQARSIGCKEISLGKRILRTETAGLAILSVLMFQVEK